MKKHGQRFGIWNTCRTKFRRHLVPALFWLGKPIVLARRHLRPHKISLWKIESAATEKELPLKILCSGTRSSKSFFIGLAFDGVPQETDLGQVKLRDVFRPGFSEKNNCPLIAIETNQAHFAWLKQDGWFFLPAWVAGGVKLPVTKEAINNTSTKNDLRKIKRYELGYSVTQDEARFADFYHNMHLPFVQKTYGDEAVYDTLAEKRAQCENFELLLVHKKSRPDYDVAGVLLVYEPTGPRFWSVGVRQDGEDYTQVGAQAALYHFAFDHVSKKHSWMSLGGSRPFLRDGVLNHKRKLSQSIREGFWLGWALKVAAFTPGVKNFLLKNPFVFMSDGALHGAVFVDEPLSPEKIQRLHKDFFYPGLQRLVIHTFCEDEKFSPAALPSPLAKVLEIRRASELVAPGIKKSQE